MCPCPWPTRQNASLGRVEIKTFQGGWTVRLDGGLKQCHGRTFSQCNDTSTVILWTNTSSTIVLYTVWGSKGGWRIRPGYGDCLWGCRHCQGRTFPNDSAAAIERLLCWSCGGLYSQPTCPQWAPSPWLTTTDKDNAITYKSCGELFDPQKYILRQTFIVDSLFSKSTF